MKRMVTLLVAFTMLFAVVGSTTAFAVDRESPNAPKLSYISAITPSLSFSGTTATMTCIVDGIIGTTTKITVTGTLQRSVSGSWIDGTPVSQTANSYRMTFSKTATGTRGYSYRVKYVVTAYALNEKKLGQGKKKRRPSYEKTSDMLIDMHCIDAFNNNYCICY